MAKRTYTEAEKQAALALYETDGPTAVKDQLGIPKQTVMGWARKTGTHTVRNEKTGAATEARQADAKALRSSLANDSITAARKALGIINRLLDADDHSLKDVATVYGILTDKHLALERVHVDEREMSAVDQWLDFVTGGADSAGTANSSTTGPESPPSTIKPVNVDPSL